MATERRPKLQSFVKLRGSQSPNAVGVITDISREDGKTVIVAIAPHGEKLIGPVEQFELVTQPTWEIGDFAGVRGVRQVVVIKMTQKAKFNVIYGPRNSISNIQIEDITDLHIAKHSAVAFLRQQRTRFRQA